MSKKHVEKTEKKEPVTIPYTGTTPLIGGTSRSLALYKWLRAGTKEDSVVVVDGEIISPSSSYDFSGDHADKARELEPTIQVTIKAGVPAAEAQKMLDGLGRKLRREEKAKK